MQQKFSVGCRQFNYQFQASKRIFDSRWKHYRERLIRPWFVLS